MQSAKRRPCSCGCGSSGKPVEYVTYEGEDHRTIGGDIAIGSIGGTHRGVVRALFEFLIGLPN